MPRLKLIEPKTATGKAREQLEGPLKDKQLNIFKAMVNSPAALEAYLGMETALARGALSAKEREVIQLVVGEANGCEYCVSAHTGLAQRAGLSEKDTIAIRKGKGPADPRLQALTRFVVALHEKKGWVKDEDVKRARDAGFDDAHLAEIVANFALATYTNYFNHLNQTPVDLPKAPALA